MEIETGCDCASACTCKQVANTRIGMSFMIRIARLKIMLPFSCCNADSFLFTWVCIVLFFRQTIKDRVSVVLAMMCVGE